jgi:hypothetical protein
LQAFADRISFICFTPKAFARKSSRAQMLWRAHGGQRLTLTERLTLQQLDVLQDVVSSVEVPATVSEGLEALADTLERELLAQVVKLPDYVPTKYFSQRPERLHHRALGHDPLVEPGGRQHGRSSASREVGTWA